MLLYLPLKPRLRSSLPKRLPRPVLTFQPSATSTNGDAASFFIIASSYDVERGLVDQADFGALLLQADDRIERAVDGFAEGDDVAAACWRFADDVVLAGLERLALVQRLAGFVEDVGHGRAGAEEEAQARVVEDALHAGGELVLVGGEVQPRGVLAVAGLDAAVGEHAVDAEVAGVVGHVIARRCG